jgi:hypothetical protein
MWHLGQKRGDTLVPCQALSFLAGADAVRTLGSEALAWSRQAQAQLGGGPVSSDRVQGRPVNNIIPCATPTLTAALLSIPKRWKQRASVRDAWLSQCGTHAHTREQSSALEREKLCHLLPMETLEDTELSEPRQTQQLRER